jgi:hypothetical protein
MRDRTDTAHQPRVMAPTRIAYLATLVCATMLAGLTRATEVAVTAKKLIVIDKLAAATKAKPTERGSRTSDRGLGRLDGAERL